MTGSAAASRRRHGRCARCGGRVGRSRMAFMLLLRGLLPAPPVGLSCHQAFRKQQNKRENQQ